MDPVKLFGRRSPGPSRERLTFTGIVNELKIDNLLQDLERQVGFGGFWHTIGFRARDGSSPPSYIVVVYSKTTPKSNTRSIPTGWTRGGNALRWFFKPLAPQNHRTIEFYFIPEDTIELQSTVGSCITASVDGKKTVKGKDVIGGLTQGLVFRDESNNKDKALTLITGHGFDHSKFETKENLSWSEANSILFCDDKDTPAACPACAHSQCATYCFDAPMSALKTRVAHGEDIQLLGAYKGPQDRTVTIPGQGSEVHKLYWVDLGIYKTDRADIKPLTITRAELLAALPAGGAPGSEVQIVRTQIEALVGVAGPIDSEDTLKLLDTAAGPLVMFKKGYKTNWTVGKLFAFVDGTAIYTALKEAALETKLSDRGDCGAIWFIIDPEHHVARPFAYHQAGGFAVPYDYANLHLLPSHLSQVQLDFKEEDSYKWGQ